MTDASSSVGGNEAPVFKSTVYKRKTNPRLKSFAKIAAAVSAVFLLLVVVGTFAYLHFSGTHPAAILDHAKNGWSICHNSVLHNRVTQLILAVIGGVVVGGGGTLAVVKIRGHKAAKKQHVPIHSQPNSVAGDL